MEKQLIVFVDDDSIVSTAVKKTLERHDYRVLCLCSAKHCLKFMCREEYSLVITDFNMPDMNGITLTKEIKKRMPTLPVLIVTGYGNISMAVRAVKAGATDVIEKPLDSNVLLFKVRKLLQKNHNGNIVAKQILSETEEKMLQLILIGKTNKEISKLVFRSVRTIESHRYRIMTKMGAHNMVELAKAAYEMGYLNLE